MGFAEIDAFAREAERVEQTLDRIGPDDWARPGLGSWTLAELVFHLVRQADRLAVYRERPLSDDHAVSDRVAYLRGTADLAADVAARARDGAAQVDPATLPARFAEAWRQSVAAAPDPDALIETIAGPMRTADYAATRVVELVVHHMDVRRALDVPPEPDVGAAMLVVNLLEDLLDGQRPRNLGRIRFILAATGRILSNDPRLPLLR